MGACREAGLHGETIEPREPPLVEAQFEFRFGDR
jgi:hypothetical protein